MAQPRFTKKMKMELLEQPLADSLKAETKKEVRERTRNSRIILVWDILSRKLEFNFPISENVVLS